MHCKPLSISIKIGSVKLPQKIPWVPALLALATLLLTQLPYLYAAISAGSQYKFIGFLINPLDGLSYLAKMHQGWLGTWRFRLPYSADPGQGAYLFLFYIFLGHLARWTHLSILLTYHLARFLGSIFMLWALYRFFGKVFSDSSMRRTAFALAVLGSGIGWLAVPFGAVTSDFWVAEAYPFLSAFSTPHFAIGLGLLLELLAPLAESVKGALPHSLWRLAGVILLAFLLGILSPFGVVIAIVVCAGMVARFAIGHWEQVRREIGTLLRAPEFIRLIWIGVGGGPWLLYDYWVVNHDPVLYGWNAQNLTPSPAIWDLILALSPALLLAIFGFMDILRKDNRGLHLLVIWSGLGLVLLYLPVGLQRRFLMGIFVPISGLAAVGLFLWSQRSRRSQAFLTAFTLLVSMPTLAIIFLGALQVIQQRDANFYLSKGEDQALQWLDVHTPPGALVVASPQTGALIPAFTGRRVIYGHPFETVNALQEEANLENFFQADSHAWDAHQAMLFLLQRQADYVWVGPRERQLGGLPAGLNLSPAYSQDGIDVYYARKAP
jgi:hypothetical protein